MKQLIGIWVLMTCCFALHSQDTTYFQDGKTIASITSTEGDRVTSQFYHDNGQLKLIRRQLDRKLHGLQQSWCSDGSPSSYIEYTHGQYSGLYKKYDCGTLRELVTYQRVIKDQVYRSVRQGPCATYSATAVLLEAGEYEDNQKKGKWKSYYENGQLKRIEYYDGGLRTGRWVYYDENGTKRGKGQAVITTYRDRLISKPNGKQISYHANGKKAKVSYYDLGKQVKTESTYAENGQLIQSRNFTKTGLWRGWQQWWTPDGKLLQRYYVTGSSPTQYDGQFFTTHDNGQLWEMGQYTHNVKTGPWKEYYENGQLTYATEYLNGVPTGTFVKYFPNGDTMLFEEYQVFTVDGRDTSLRHGLSKEFLFSTSDSSAYPTVQTTYQKGLKNGVRETWYFNGQLADHREYVDDQQTGLFFAFDRDGRLQRKTVFRSTPTGQPITRIEYKYAHDGNLAGVARLPYGMEGKVGLEEHYYNNGQPSTFKIHPNEDRFFVSFHPSGLLAALPYVNFYPNGVVKTYVQPMVSDSTPYFTLLFDPLGLLVDGKIKMNKQVIAEHLTEPQKDSLSKRYRGIKANHAEFKALKNGVLELSIHDEVQFTMPFENGLPEGQASLVLNGVETKLYLKNGFLEGKHEWKHPSYHLVIHYQNGLPVDSSLQYVDGQLTRTTWYRQGRNPMVYAKEWTDGDGIKYYENDDTGVRKEWYAHGRLKSDFAPMPGTDNLGLYQSWYENGQLQTRRIARAPHFTAWTGCDTTWTENGVVATVNCVENGQKNGSYFSRLPDGSIWKGTYQQGKKDGLWVSKDAKGNTLVEERYELGWLKAELSGIPCECIDKTVNGRSTTTSASRIWAKDSLIKYQSPFHGPIGDWYDHLRVRAHSGSFDVYAYRPAYLSFPNSNGFQLRLSVCENAKGVSKAHIWWDDDDPNPTLSITSSKMAIDFPPTLLNAWDEFNHAPFDLNGSPRSARLTFAPGKLEYRTDKIKLKKIEETCFTKAQIGNTGTLLTLEDFDISLLATQKQFAVTPQMNAFVVQKEAKEAFTQWLVVAEDDPPNIRALNGMLEIPAIGKIKGHWSLYCQYVRIWPDKIDFIVMVPDRMLSRKLGIKQVAKTLKSVGYQVKQELVLEGAQETYLQLEFKRP